MGNFISANGTITTIDENRRPRSFKQLLGFLKMNQGRDCFGKFQGKVWMITIEGTWKEVGRNIPDLTYKEYLKISIQ